MESPKAAPSVVRSHLVRQRPPGVSGQVTSTASEDAADYSIDLLSGASDVDPATN